MKFKMHVEKLTKDTWDSIYRVEKYKDAEGRQAVKNYYGYENPRPPSSVVHLLLGVHPYDNNFPGIALPRGLPHDVAAFTRQAYRRVRADSEYLSFLTLRELAKALENPRARLAVGEFADVVDRLHELGGKDEVRIVFWWE